ncbi:myogenesis-regulating glycosidase-like isoform X2 [Lineus longissimus]|uniref:myogenesis-regulating glycosidase-like isoform X2 n=1 Tax=Lineus longissimus TaxID=88925 RepID=UPI00315DB16D
MELNGVAASGPFGDGRERSQSDTTDISRVFSNDSINSALSAVSGLSSGSSVNSQVTCVNTGVKNGALPMLDQGPKSTESKCDAELPKTDLETNIPAVAVLSPARSRKTFVVEKVDEDKLRADQDELESPKKDLPIVALFKPEAKRDSIEHADVKSVSLPEEEPEVKPAPFVKRKDSVFSGLIKGKKTADGNESSPRPSRKLSFSHHRKNCVNRRGSIETATNLSVPGRKKSKDESRTRSGTIESAEHEEGQRDQLLELPKIKKNKRKKDGNRRVSYNDLVVKIPTDDEYEDNDDVFVEKTPNRQREGPEDDMEEDVEEKPIIPRLKKRRPLFRPQDRSIKVLLIVLFLLMVGGVTCIWIFYKKQLYEVEIGKKITFNHDTRTLIVREFGSVNVSLEGVLGLNVPHVLPYLCSHENHQTELCVRWPGHAVLNIKYWDATDSIGCYNITWEMLSDAFIPRDCFKMDNANWYGGGLMSEQLWPLEKQEHKEMPYVTGNILDGEYGSVIQAYWLSSQGISLVVPTNVPLWASLNASIAGDASGLCLSATYTGPYRQLSETVGSHMEYSLCKGTDLKSVHTYMISKVVGTLSNVPKGDFFRYPGWSTWGKYGKNITQDKVFALYQEIKQNNFPASHLEIYDKWEQNYGDIVFDEKKFPNPRQLVTELTKGGVEIMACVHPFVDTRSEIFQEGVREGYFVMNEDDIVPGLTYWWNSVGAVVDFTSSKSSAWFKSRLLTLQNQTGIKSFRFDAGEVSWLPHKPHFSIPQINPLEYSRKYVELAESLGGKTIVTSSFHNQDIPVIIRIHDKSPTWGYDNGLKSIIPTVLTLNLIGYPYLQLQVGSGGDTLHHDVQNFSFVDLLPTRELYLRTLQIAIFLPSFQFSVPPWQFDQEMTDLAKQYVKFHEDFVMPRIQTLFSNYTKKGLPILRPLWWLENTEEARTIDSEFLIGDTVLVAPMLEKGKSKRNIYLPRGNWQDPFKGMIIEGGIWLKHYSVPDNVVPYFVHES